jgi:hypothetical protein
MVSVFKKTLTVDETAETLYGLMQKDSKQEWRSKLSSASGLDPVRAEDELVFLDFFAIYFSLKFTRSPGWHDKGILVFEKLFSLVLSWFGSFLESKNAGTRDDAFRILDGRLKAYGATIERPSSADPDEMIRSVGLTYAAYAFAEDSFYGADGRPREDRFPDFLRKLSQDHGEIVIAVGGEVFNHRMQMLYTWFDSHEVA